MRGSISRRGDSWRVHVYLGLDSQTGKQRYLTRTVHGTKRDAERVCTELVTEADRGGFGDTSAVTFAELVERWLEHLKPNVSPATLAAYKNYMRKWILPALGTRKLDRIRPVDLDLFYASLRPHLAGASVRKVHTILHSVLGQATRWQLIGTNPAAAATPPRFDKPAINPPTPEEVGRLLAAADERDPEFGLFLRLAAVTGARRGELCGLRWTDYDPAAGEIVLRRSIVQGEDGVEVKKTKTNRDRRLAVDATTVAALDRHHGMVERRAKDCGGRLASGAYIFSRDVEGLEPWRPDSGVTGRFAALRSSIGLPHVRLHDLRHYVATRLLDAGVPVRSVSERLGHASATTTLTIYAAPVPATDRRAAEILGNLLASEDVATPPSDS